METLTDLSQIRTWIYRSVKKLSSEQESEIIQRGTDFIGQWAAHGKKLAAEFEILHHHFLVFFVDQSMEQNSGCSIDASVAFIKEIENEFQLGLLDRQKIAFRINDEIIFHDFQNLEKLYHSGEINDASLIFDPLVQNRSDFNEKFLSPFNQSQYFRLVQ